MAEKLAEDLSGVIHELVIEEVRAAVKTIRPLPGPQGPQGPAGKDADPLEIKKTIKDHVRRDIAFGGGGVGLPPGTGKGQSLINLNNPNTVTSATWSYALGVPAEGFGVSASSSASINTAALQLALNVTGTVTLTVPGTYLVNDTLQISSNTTFRLGAGVILKLADNSNKLLLRNTNWDSAVQSVTGNLTTAATAVGGICNVTANCTGHTFQVGDYVLIKGDTTQRFVGVHRVATVSTNQFTFVLGGNSTDLGSSAGTITAAKANFNITISGPGAIDFNAVNNDSGLLLNGMCIILNKVGNCSVRDLTGYRTAIYFISLCNAHHCVVKNIHHYEGNADTVHIHGPSRGIVVDTVYAQMNDDAVAMTCTNDNGFNQYDLPDGNGSYQDISISNIIVGTGSIGRGCGIYVTGGYRSDNVIVRNMFCEGKWRYPVMLNCASADTGDYGDILIDGIYGELAQDAFAAVIAGIDGTISIDSLTIRNVTTKSYRAAPLISVGTVATTTVRKLLIDNVSGSYNDRYSLIGISNGTFGDVDIQNCSLNLDQANAASGFTFLLTVTAPVSVGRLTLTNCSISGQGTATRTGSMIFTANTPAGFVASFNGCSNYGNTNMFPPVTISGGNTPTFVFNNCTSAGKVFAESDTNVNLVINGLQMLSSTAGFLFNFYGTSVTFNLRLKNISNIGAVANFWNYQNPQTYNLIEGDGTVTIKSDTAGITFTPSAGAIYRDTQAATPGLYARGATTTTRLTA